MNSDLAGGTIAMIVNEDEESVTGEKGLFTDSGSRVRRIIKVQAEDLAASLRNFCQQIAAMMSNVDFTGGFGLESIEVQIELTAKGEVRLIGAAGAETKGGVKLTFTRPGEQRTK